MFKLRKKEIAFVSIGIIISMLFTGCTESKSTSNQANGKKVDIRWVLMGEKKVDSDAVFADFNEKLQQKMPGVTVNFEMIPGANYVEKWKLNMASAEPMDLAWTGYMFTYSDEVKKDSYQPIDALLEKYAPDLKSELPDWLWEKAKSDGKIYSVPNYQIMTDWRVGVFTQKELGDKYMDAGEIERVTNAHQFTVKEDWDVLEKYLEKLKQNNELRLGASPVTLSRLAERKGYEWILSEGLPFVLAIDDKDLKVLNLFETEPIKLMYDVMADWFQKGYIRKDILSIQDPRIDESKLDGTGYVLWAASYLDPIKAPQAKEGVLISKGVPLAKNYFINSTQSQTATVIPMTAKNPDVSIKLLDLINTKKGSELYNVLSYGIEGSNYKKVANNSVENILDNGKPKYLLNNWVVGNTFNGYEPSEGYNEYIKSVNNDAIKSKLMGFKADTSMLKTEIAQVTAVQQEFEKPLKFGALANHKEAYEKMITKIKKAGADKIIEELQKQIDVWAKSNGIK